MKPSLPVKITAVAFSLTLGCAYVGYRGASAPNPSDATKATTGQKSAVVLPGSKSSAGLETLQLRKPVQAGNPAQPAGAPRPLLPGSKNMDHVLMDPNRSGQRTTTDFLSPMDGTAKEPDEESRKQSLREIDRKREDSVKEEQKPAATPPPIPPGRAVFPGSKSGPIFPSGGSEKQVQFPPTEPK